MGRQSAPAVKLSVDLGKSPSIEQPTQSNLPETQAAEASPAEPNRTTEPAPAAPAAAQVEPLSPFLRERIVEIVRRFGYQGEITIQDKFIDRVMVYIRYFTEDHTGARFFRRALVRSRSSVPMITRVLRDKQLPEDLAYLALIESGFNPNARSTAGAIGMWQFMEGTARDYGLVVAGNTDERRSPEKSTAAAAEHLDNLLAVFGTEDPFLGISAYNAGEGKVIGALKRVSFRERSFWALVGNGLLQAETEEYIPKLLAAIILVNDREKFGLTDQVLQQERVSNEEEIVVGKRALPISAAEPSRARLTKSPKPNSDNATYRRSEQPAVLLYKAKRGDTLGRVAAAFGVSVSNLMVWNGKDTETLYRGETLQIHPEVPCKLFHHPVQKGETLSKIAVSYHVNPEMIALMNESVGQEVRTGEVLQFYAPATPVVSSPKASVATIAPSGHEKGYKVEYTVQKGSSLSHIALAFDLEVSEIRHWNKMKGSHIQAGQKLTLFLSFRPLKVSTHTVRKGETAGSIARHYGVRLYDDLFALNGLVNGSKLTPGMKLKVYRFAISAG